MNKISVEGLLALSSIPGIGATRMRKLISVFHDPDAVLRAGVRRLMEVEGVDRITAEKIASGPDERFVRKQLSFIKQFQAGILTYWDEQYPEPLKSIYDPPAFLFYKGDLSVLKTTLVAVVGTRRPTIYGKQVTEQIVRELVENGLGVISGFARGVDTLAHRVTLQRGGKTVAVFGNGIDRIYPPENHELYQQIVEQGGLLLTEYPMGTKPDAVNFPKRNRIISGLARAVLVTEAGEKSGALLTAYYANDQNRDVFAVPGPITSEQSKGTNRIIREGAILVQEARQILEELRIEANKQSPTAHTSLTPAQQKIIQLLEQGPLHVDQIALQTNLSPSAALSELLTLELLGLIRQMAGKMFVRL